jgi:dolichyl-diphosphooligosaccharide--protein glycosyltransferase
MAPSLADYRLPVSNLVDRARGEPLSLRPADSLRRSALDAAVWLRQNTPPTSGYFDPDGAPEYGVLAPWGFGHLLKYSARRPTVVGNFGDDVGDENLRRVDAYLRNPEPAAARILDDLKVRYVLLQTLTDEALERFQGDAMRRRLSVDDSPGLAHHRLLYESPLNLSRAVVGRSEVRVFEYVRGADVSGRAAPGAIVRASLDYESNRGRRGSYRTSAQADASGRYRMRLAYSTRGAPPGVAADTAYRISAGGRTVLLAVDEKQVRDGLPVSGPSFFSESGESPEPGP